MAMAVGSDEALMGQRYTGVVKKIIPGPPAHGFIDCEETMTIFGRDVFLHDQLALTLAVGQAVSFTVVYNAKGMPQATEVLTAEGASLPPPANQQWTAPAQPRGSGLKGASRPPMPSAGRLYDVLLPEVSAAMQNGLQQSVAAAMIGAAELIGVAEDIWMQLAGTRSLPGAPVVAAQKGGCPPRHPTSFQPATSSGSGWKGKGDRYQPYDMAASARPANAGRKGGPQSWSQSQPAAEPELDGPHEGVVKSIKPMGTGGVAFTHGFVECEAIRLLYGRDVFLNDSQAEGLEVGARVRFDVALNARGMPQAHNLQMLT